MALPNDQPVGLGLVSGHYFLKNDGMGQYGLKPDDGNQLLVK
jgi:hypothetical protein